MAAVESGAQSIDRAAQILVRLMESDETVTLASVIEETRLPKTTAARLLRALERNGLAQRRPGGGFRPGPVLVDYARRDSAVGDLASWRFRFWRASSRSRARRRTSRSRRRPASRGSPRSATIRSARATGRAPHPDPHVLDGRFIIRRPTPFGRLARLGDTITSIPDLLAELEQVRRNGYATTWEELEAGLCSAAAPVRGARGTVIAAISVSAPTVRTSRERFGELTRHVVEAAAALSDHLRNHKQEGTAAA